MIVSKIQIATVHSQKKNFYDYDIIYDMYVTHKFVTITESYLFYPKKQWMVIFTDYICTFTLL